MGHIQMGVPKSLVLRLLGARAIPNFVETGTFRGGTTLWAAKHFQNVVTIEINPELSREVAARPDCAANIQFLVGDSATLMAEVVAGLCGSAVFWLDGHYCGPGTGDPSAECPVMGELEALRAATDPIIMIDDARCFLGPPLPPHNRADWVSIDDLYRFFIQHFPWHTTTLVDDVIVSVPRDLKPVLDQDWLEHFERRYPSKRPSKPSLASRLLKKVLRPLPGVRWVARKIREYHAAHEVRQFAASSAKERPDMAVKWEDRASGSEPS
jgi:hypothetical protein